jgi:16S rRNA (guanine(966)-N(2))-methyltransferase RsmD
VTQGGPTIAWFLRFELPMRIIAGALRGRRLESPHWAGLRPSSDRLRETLFNVLAALCADARVLDLCAGSGAVGIEAISRGAAHVTFVEADARACQLIARNLSRCGVAEGYTILRSTIEQAFAALDGGYRIVFLDPPYDDPSLDRWVERAGALVAPGGVLVVEHARRRPLAATAGLLTRTRELRSGDTSLGFYRHRNAMGQDEVAAHADPA